MKSHLTTSKILLQLCLIIFADGCNLGLTQMRYPSLALMYCNRPRKGERDPCPAMVGGRDARCQLDDVKGNYVCCGTTELLIDLLSKKAHDSDTKKSQNMVTETKRPYPTVSYSAIPSSTTTALPLKPKDDWMPPVIAEYAKVIQDLGYYIYPNPQKLEKLNSPKNKTQLYSTFSDNPSKSASFNQQPYSFITMNPSITNIGSLNAVGSNQTPTQSPTTVATKYGNQSADNYTLVFGPELTPYLASIFTGFLPDNAVKKPVDQIDFSQYGEDAYKRTTKLPNNAVKEDGPLLSLMTAAQCVPGNITNTWIATSSVVLLQDGPCSIIVNTGLPVQKNEIIANLATKGITGNKLDYTVITSGLPQFIGNINLFPASQFIIGLMYAHWTTIALSNIAKASSVDLCSSKTQIIHTPGPSPDAITVVARNVPAMGTVAIAGALFIQNDEIERIERPFVWDKKELFASRKKVICISDWIIPAHSAPFFVSQNLKKRVGCSTV